MAAGKDKTPQAQPQTNDKMQAALASATKAASAPLQEWNPLEDVPTLTVGEDLKAGMTINGYFVETQRISSPKFTYSQERDENGVTVAYRHVIRTEDGHKLGIWSTGELRLAFERLVPNDFISLTYKGKGTNAKGQSQHFFEYRRAQNA